MSRRSVNKRSPATGRDRVQIASRQLPDRPVHLAYGSAPRGGLAYRVPHFRVVLNARGQRMELASCFLMAPTRASGVVVRRFESCSVTRTHRRDAAASPYSGSASIKGSRAIFASTGTCSPPIAVGATRATMIEASEAWPSGAGNAPDRANAPTRGGAVW